MPGKIFRFGPTPEHRAHHLFVFLHGCGATPKSMIPIAFRFQARFPSAALVVPSGFAASEVDGAAQQWFSSRGLTDDNRVSRVEAILPRLETLVRREQTNFGVPVERTVLIGFSQGGTVALEAVKQLPGLAGAQRPDGDARDEVPRHVRPPRERPRAEDEHPPVRKLAERPDRGAGQLALRRRDEGRREVSA